MRHARQNSEDVEHKKVKTKVDISFLDVNADDDISFYSVSRDPNGALINLAAS